MLTSSKHYKVHQRKYYLLNTYATEYICCLLKAENNSFFFCIVAE